jgi:cell division protein FtsI (penicillin-binding protein 3)
MSSRYVASHIASLYSPTPDYFLDWYRTFCVSPSEFTHGTMPCMRMTSKGEDGMTDLMSVGAGYGFTMCPLQILTFYNTVANGGRMMLPMLVKGSEDKTEGYLTVLPREREERVLRQEVADTLRRALAACVEDGTGKRLSGMPLQMAGKTGTSRQIIDPELRGGSADPYHDQERRSQYASTFVRFYPADEPHYSVMCVLFTRPTHQIYPGGSLPAETVREFVSRIEAVR